MIKPCLKAKKWGFAQTTVKKSRLFGLFLTYRLIIKKGFRGVKAKFRLNWHSLLPSKNIHFSSNLGKRVAKAPSKSSSKTSSVDHPKALIIAEKPSVANDIAKALGGFTKHEDYFESDDFLISSAVGHLLEIAAPEEYDVKRGKWSFANLPVVPPYFDLRPIAKTESRLKVLQKLILL